MLTTAHGLPKPELTDAPNGPAQIGALAEAVDTKLLTGGYSEVLTSETTAAAGANDLATVGPSVTVTVPANGLVAVHAEVTLSAPSGDALTYLTEDGVAGAILVNTTGIPVPFYTVPGSTVGIPVDRHGGLLVMPVSAGSHTYKLQYGSSAGAAATFLNRRLWVKVLPY